MMVRQYDSEIAQQLERDLSRMRENLHRSFVLGDETIVRGELAEVFSECSEPDWDGHNALPVKFGCLFDGETILAEPSPGNLAAFNRCPS